jgi:hypothetical protein
MTTRLVGLLQPTFRRCFGLGQGGACVQRGPVVINRYRTVFLQVEYPAQIDMGPRNHFGFARDRQCLLKIVAGIIDLAVRGCNLGQDEKRPARILSLVV